MPFEAFGSGLEWLISVHRLISVIGFEPFNNLYLVAFVLPGLAICFRVKMLCFLSQLFVF